MRASLSGTDGAGLRGVVLVQGSRRPLSSIRILAAGALSFTGCVEFEASYAPTARHQPVKPKDPASVELVLAEDPKKPFEIVGTIETQGSNGEGDQSRLDLNLKLLRDKAASVGVDGVCRIVCAPPGSTTRGNCTGLAFMWKP